MQAMFWTKLCKMIYRKWWLIMALAILFAGFFIYLGYSSIQFAAEDTMVDATQSTEYQEAIQSYDAAIAEVQESLTVAEAQVEAQQDYCDNSLYMQMDSTSYYVASMLYSLEGAGDAMTYILNKISIYMKAQHLGPVVKAALPEVHSEYLAEVFACNVSGNLIYFTVSYFDKEEATAIIKIIEQDMQEHMQDLFEVYGIADNCNLEKVSEDITVLADATILNTQNSNLNNLKTYKNIVADHQKKIADLQAEKQQYMIAVVSTEEDAEGEISAKSPQMVLVQYGIIGLLLGILIPIIGFAIILIADDRIKDVSGLSEFGLVLFGSAVDNDILDNLSAFMKKKNIGSLFFNILPKKTDYEECVETLEKIIPQLEIQANYGQINQGLETELKKLLMAEGCILVINFQYVTATQIREQIQICQRLEIPVLGCVQV